MSLFKRIKLNRNPIVYIRTLIEIFALALTYTVGYVMSSSNNIAAFFWMLCTCIAFFVYYAILGRNLFDLRAILYGSITGAISVCQLRLSQIQVVWDVKTWALFAIALAFFSIGFAITEVMGIKGVEKEDFKEKKTFFKRFVFRFNPQKVYYTTIFLAVMPIVLFCIQVWIKGFIPIFVQRYDAYILFYTRLSIFINLVIFSAPLAFWCLKNIKLNTKQRILMYSILPLPTIIFQLMVQRGLFVWSICILLIMVYLQSKRKVLGVVLMVGLLIFGIIFSSAMRAIPADAMNEIWKIDEEVKIEINSEPPEKGNNSNEVIENNPDEVNGNDSIKIKIPSFVYAPYYYVINGMENFNEMIVNLEQHSNGLRQLTPFTVVLRFQALKETIKKYPSFRILPSSTSCLICDFYYDFGLIGVVIEMLLLGVLCAIVQKFAKNKNNLFAILEYGVLLAIILTAFFAAWITEFGSWLFAGTAFLVFLYVYFEVIKKPKSNEEAMNG